MPSRFRSQCAMLCTALILTALTGCATAPNAEPPLIVQCPKPTPLPAAVQRIDLKPSTASLSKGLEWSQTSEAILSEGIAK